MRRLHRVMPLVDALKVVCRTTRNRAHLQLSLAPCNRHVTVRANTSDVKCLEKVFIDKEYRLPSDINAGFAIRPKFIVDAGANIGMATLYFAHAFPDAHVYAIEPESSNFDLLSRNCEGLKNISLKKAALWPVETKLQLADPKVDYWMFSVQPATGSSPSIEGINIPRILAESGANRIDLLKLDIEGAERELFCEESESWLPRIGMIVIELHDRFKSGCGEAFYSRMVKYHFEQEIRGENIFLHLKHAS